MKNILIILLIIISCCGCTKENSEFQKFESGTYYGEKTIHYQVTNSSSVDTITIRFENGMYSYSSSDALDFGRGNYLIKSNSIEFNDNEARIALYSWDWILGGIHKFRMAGDSLILNQDGSYINVSCKLSKIVR
jgi:hypothetical protein